MKDWYLFPGLFQEPRWPWDCYGPILIFPIPVYATIWIILIAYVTRFLPYGMRAVSSTIIQVHKELEEASVACGAGFLATFRRVLIPMMRPGVMAGWIILVTIFMREFSATLFLYSPGSEPLGPLLYFLYLDGMRGRVAAIGLVISVISVILIAIAQRYSHWDIKVNRGSRIQN